MFYFLFFFSITFVHAKQEIVIGVLAKRGTVLTLKRWVPTAQYLQKMIPQYNFTIKALSFEQIHPAVKSKEIDFILANSGIYVELEHKYGVQRISTLLNKHITGISQKQFGGVIFTHSDNKIFYNSLNDIKGKHFIAVNKKSLGGWQMAWRELKKAGINPFSDLKSLTFQGTHDKVVYDILEKKADVGTVRSDTLERMVIEGKIKIKDFHIINQKKHQTFPFISSTTLYPEWPFAKLQHISDQLSKEVAIALMTMLPTDSAAKAGKLTAWSTPMNYTPVHDCFKELEIPPYDETFTFWDVVQNYWAWILFYIVLALLGISMLIYQFRLTSYLKSTQNELVQTEKMASLGRLVAGISHEINTPLGISITAASHHEKESKLIQKRYDEDQMKRSDLEHYLSSGVQATSMILSNLQRASRLIDSFKQISVDQTSNETRVFSLLDYLESIVTSLKPSFKQNKHSVDVFCDESIKIDSNPGAFSQIFTNLIMNSLIHGFEHKNSGHITIEAIELPHKLILIYTDDGQGLNSKDIDKHFDPFYTSKRNTGGSGLGTHIIYNLVTQKLFGTINATSEVGHGISYTIELDERGFKYVK